MLRIYGTVIEVLGRLRPVIEHIEGRDRDLARQLRRAASSIALNVSEGSGSRGGTRRERYCNALRSARETTACLDVAAALGYIEGVDAVLADQLDHVRATLCAAATPLHAATGGPELPSAADRVVSGRAGRGGLRVQESPPEGARWG